MDASSLRRDARVVTQLVCLEHEGGLPMKEAATYLASILDDYEARPLLRQQLLNLGKIILVHGERIGRSYEQEVEDLCASFYDENPQYAPELPLLQGALLSIPSLLREEEATGELQPLDEGVDALLTVFAVRHEPFRFVGEVTYFLLERITPAEVEVSSVLGAISL